MLGVDTVNGVLYAIGGFTGTAAIATVEAYDPMSNLWTPKASMPVAKRSFGTAMLDGRIYSIGGFNGTGTLVSTVDIYQP
jgi:hypothetical protein